MAGGLRVLAIEIVRRGFAYAVLEGQERLIDWGGCRVSGDVSLFLAKLRPLLERYRVDALVLEEPAESRRNARSRGWLVWAEQYAADQGIQTPPINREALRRAFGHGVGRHQIAVEVARLFPQLAPRLPERRRPWDTESERLGLFIAVARALTALRAAERSAATRT